MCGRPAAWGDGWGHGRPWRPSWGPRWQWCWPGHSRKMQLSRDTNVGELSVTLPWISSKMTNELKRSAGSQCEDIHPWQRSWGRRLGITQRWDWASGDPRSRASTPKTRVPTLLFYALTYTSDFTGGWLPTTSFGEGVNLQLQVNKNSWAWQECFNLQTPLKVL